MSSKSIKELVDLAAEGDEDAAAEIEQRFGEQQSKVVGAERKLKLTTDKELREKYPRAIMAWEKGRFDIAATLSDDELGNVLYAKEEELADLGVTVGAATGQTSGTPPVENSEGDPAAGLQALSGAAGSSGPGGSPRDEVREFHDHLKGSTPIDRAKAFTVLAELNHSKQGEKIKQITRMLEARPIETGMV